MRRRSKEDYEEIEPEEVEPEEEEWHSDEESPVGVPLSHSE